jgi:hypothetical protein
MFDFNVDNFLYNNNNFDIVISSSDDRLNYVTNANITNIFNSFDNSYNSYI